MSAISLDSTIHVFEDSNNTLPLRDILASAGYTTDQVLKVVQFLTEQPDGQLTDVNSPLLGVVDGDKLTIAPGDWQENYHGEFTTYQFMVAGANGDQVTLTLHVVVDPVNDAPVGADQAFDLADRRPVVLGEDAFGFKDVVEGDAFKSVVITSLPQSGDILLNGEAVAAGTEVGIEEIRAGHLTFQAAQDTGGTVVMGFHVRDDGGTAGPGARDTSVAVNYLSFKVPAPVSEAPADLTVKVWSDLDTDGRLDAGEAGIAGVKVILVDGAGDTVASAVTDATGTYQFAQLKAGVYSVKFDPATLPAGAKFVTGVAGSESQADAAGATPQLTLAAGQHGYLQAGAAVQNGGIASTVWHDSNGNGVQDNAEKGVSNVTVHLFDAQGTEVARTLTNASGEYGFTQAAGNYAVKVDAPAGYVFSAANVGTNEAVDSDVDAGGVSGTFAVVPGHTVDPADAGMYKTASIGNRVWFDCDGDGIQDAGDFGIGGVKVTLLDGSDKAVGTMTTDSNGQYLFTGLKPGAYSVQFDKSALPAGYLVTARDAGSNDGLDSDIDASGRSQQVTLASGEVNTTVDAGVTQAATIGDRVWLDSNGNGIQDSGEAGVAGVAVMLTNQKGDTITTTTDSNGNYKFNVVAGTYSVSIKTPDGYAITKQNAGTANTDSNADGSGKLGTVTVAAGASNLSMDAGLTQGASVGNRVWEDSNANGIQDAGEKGICNVGVKLYDVNHRLLATTTTAADGSYGFGKLAAGTYSIEVARPDGYYVTKTNIGSDLLDNDFKLANNIVSSTFKLAANEQNTSIDAGLYQKASLGDKVWRDANHNGIQDRGEEGIGKIKVALYSSGGAFVASTTTDASGNYLFKDLDPGSYYLQFDKSNVIFRDSQGRSYAMNDWKWGLKNAGSNDQIDSDVAGDAANKINVTKTGTIVLASGEKDMSWDAAITPIAIDLNGDGIHTIARADFAGSFDLLGTGNAIQSGWLAADDAFLAIDLNGNGKIDDIGELFGGMAKGSGFAKLASFDSNGDGFLTAADTDFAKLILWQDANSDGVTNAGELVSLAKAGVSALAVAYQELPYLDANGNLHLERSSAVIDGRQVDMTDVYFNVAAADVAAAGIDAVHMATLVGQSTPALF